ncbi:hypothetical protein KC363_g6663 [Hortaea werneckii]|uniref:TauD/TfdA-like domain-containing protein n=1 Tax=Hortaea werneckii TaxID=91943 RepID=A0A3M7FCE2_HORWE|nr:hypothetical protein KC361_g3920 [Hortaea werneckii]KAI6887415.1 hypothetical protein KC325_g2170 [Hortaea werneckii]KAI7001318.1 hypothetical protein KC359_g715 [Hortaea werneckii]KAI7148966.1 hypothetical protein KC344_g1469 [Hortaea werneckii]KAI7178614.1 hypothetical protein KC360_g1490 [Hortaea werneckii]
MPHLVEPLVIRPLADELRKETLLGAEVILPSSIRHLDVSQLSTEERNMLREALFENGILVVRGQEGIKPTDLVSLAKLFDSLPLDIHSGGAKQVTDPKNILSQNGCTRVPSAPQVTVIGQGKYYNHEGIPEIDLKHLDHTLFHEESLSEEAMTNGYTRPYRWHMDAPLYENLPGFATVLHALEVPDVPDQKLAFPDGRVMDVAAGATAFFSGARNFELLSADEQDFAVHTIVQYAPRAYEWIKDCKATADGLSIAKRGREKAEDELPHFEWDKVHEFPMVWKNPTTGKPHLQILGCCVRALRTKDPKTGVVTTIDDLDEVRSICHSFQSPVYSPENVYAHRWQKGDLVIFHNRGVMHSITGQLARHPERRLLWQCNMASLTEPEAYGR